MRRLSSLVAVVAWLGLLAPAPLAARQSPGFPASAGPSTTTQPPKAPAGKDPYRNLFNAPHDLRQEALKQQVQAALRAQAQGLTGDGRTQPWVVCGMTIIPVDPAIDPEILRPSTAPAIEHKLRVIEPPVCFDK